MEPVKEQVEELLQAIPELEKRHDELEKKHYELDKATKPSPRVTVLVDSHLVRPLTRGRCRKSLQLLLRLQ